MSGIHGMPRRQARVKAKLKPLPPPLPSQRARFIRKLAEYLVHDEAMQSIRLEMNDPGAKIWAALRSATPLRGYLKVEEAEAQLSTWFDKGMSY